MAFSDMTDSLFADITICIETKGCAFQRSKWEPAEAAPQRLSAYTDKFSAELTVMAVISLCCHCLLRGDYVFDC